MKYLAKQCVKRRNRLLSPTLFLFLFFYEMAAFAQCDVPNYERLMREAENFARNEKYLEAIRKLSAAMIICPDKVVEPQKKIEQIFDEIDSLKNEAVGKYEAIKQRDRTETQKQKILTFLKSELSLRGIIVTDLFSYYLNQADSMFSVGLYNEASLEYKRSALLIEKDEQDSLIKNKLNEIDTLQNLLSKAGQLNSQQNYTGAIKKYQEILIKNQTDTITQIRREFAQMLLDGYMVKVPGGTFTMGDSTSSEEDEKPAHPVKLDTFYMAKYEVTQGLYKGVMGINPSRFDDNLQNPVEQVSWYDAVEFCNRLSELMGLIPCYKIKINENAGGYSSDYTVTLINSANGFRLPTEAEWEYAARGGSSGSPTTYAGSNILDSVGWYWMNSGDRKLNGEWNYDSIIANNCRTHPVGQLNFNALGLHDMSGNVWEWCWDWYANDYYQKCRNEGIVANPFGPESGDSHVLRGGSWVHESVNCRVAYRSLINPRYHWYNFGFRLCLACSSPSEPGKASQVKY